MSEPDFDVIIAGGGFAGVYSLIHLKKLGFRTKLVDPGTALGGAWHWNTYPGARVDSDIPVYEFPFDDLPQEWTWTKRFPGAEELRAYFAYVAEKYDLYKDCWMECRVESAHWDEAEHTWHVTANGKGGHHQVTSRYMITALGLTSEPYIPEIKGLATFQGRWFHSGQWPKEGIDMTDKRVGVVGTGASGVQIIQELGVQAKHLTVFQRTPNLALPLNQYEISREVQDHFKPVYHKIYEKLPTTFGGLHVDFIPRPTLSDPPEVREKMFEERWRTGGLNFWLSGYIDLFVDREGNNEAYKFWRKKTIARIKDPKLQELLAPEVAPHPFGTKRPSLEHNLYEVLQQDNVDLVDLKADPIVEVTAEGIRTKDALRDFDVLVFATGWDAISGPYMRIDIRGEGGKTIQEHWRDGVSTYLGLGTDSFPNMFILYGPQGPSALCNAPTCIGLQGQWIIDAISHLVENKITKFSPNVEATKAYAERVEELSKSTLLHNTESWYMGANIPGKSRQPYNWTGGTPAYKQLIDAEAEKMYSSFKMETLGGAALT